MVNLNILSSFKKENYFSKPFPHFVLKKSFDDHTYNLLEKDYNFIINYLEKKYSFSKSNIRLQISSTEIMKIELFKKTIWFDFINFHTSNIFFNTLLNIFEKDLILTYPKAKIDLNKKKLSVRSNFEDNKKSNYVIDCQPGINTPNNKLSTVRGPHVDNPVELIAGLFYLKDSRDNSFGGDLNIYEKKNKIYFKDKAEVMNISDLKLFKSITYEKNKSIFFLNSLNSIHSVSERSPSKFTRNLINFIIENYNQEGYFKIPRKKNFRNIISKFFKR